MTTSAVQTSTRTFVIDKAHSEATFQVRHLVTKVRGHFSDFAGTIQFNADAPEQSSVTFTMQAASIDTKTADRDTHLRSEDFFFADKHPEITFVSSKITKKGDENYEVRGTLTIRGVAKEIALPVTFLGHAKDPQHVVLLQRDAMRLDERGRPTPHQIRRPHQSEERFLRHALERLALLQLLL